MASPPDDAFFEAKGRLYFVLKDIINAVPERSEGGGGCRRRRRSSGGEGRSAAMRGRRWAWSAQPNSGSDFERTLLVDFARILSLGISSQVRPSRRRPAFFLFLPPHCLKKNGT